MTPHNFTESELESSIIELFKGQGYEYVDGYTLHRKYDDILLSADLTAFLTAQYPDLTDEELHRLIRQLVIVSDSPLYQSSRTLFWLLNEGFNLERTDPSLLPIHINFIDFDVPENNNFKIINQFTVFGSRERRPDALLFINGIPITIFEFKTAIREDTTIHDAWEQIHIRYKRDIPNLMKYCLLSVISDGANTRMGSIFTPYEYYYAWNKVTDDEKASNGISALFTMIAGAFNQKNLLSILRDFIYYPDDSPKEEAIITRYPQFFAANKMLANIKAHLKPAGDGKGGTYFGATGCGKTYTMLFLSRLLAQRERETFNNPTIIIIEDREDLDSQTSEFFVASKKYLTESNIKSIESRAELHEILTSTKSGGVYTTTIQKFCENTGLLSDRTNIICISDEAHRTQAGIGAKLKKTEDGVFTTYGFAKYLRDSFPNATYCGFTGTPVDETLKVFGPVVDSYTMKESSDDGITVRIAYEPRLARVVLSDEQVAQIARYYEQCATAGSTPEQIEASKRAMSGMRKVLGHPARLKKLASDIVEHYEKLTAQKPEIVQKAMIVCADRQLAFQVLQEIIALRPEWKDETIKLVATQGANDEPALYETCGTKEYRKHLSEEFKDNKSAFKIAIVVDMWITGFDVPSLAVMYIDKPLQKHTLIQTISRVNRVFEGKDQGLIVDYIGIKQDMLEAIKMYGDDSESPIDELSITLSVFRNHLQLLDELTDSFNAEKFYAGEPLERLNCLNLAAEFVQVSQDLENRFMTLSRKMKAAYEIAFPSGELSDEETQKAQFYLAIRSIIYKQTKGSAPDAEIMNQVAEEMVEKALKFTGIEDVVNGDTLEKLFDDDFMDELNKIDMPITKFNALLKLLRQAISEYGGTNRVKAIEFGERLQKVVDHYNNRDKMVFTSEVVADFINDLSDSLIQILKDLETDQSSFEALGITFEEKAFYDILVKIRDEHEFNYADEKCLILAKAIKEMVDDKSQYADWASRDDIKNQLNMDLTVLLYENGYPPEWDEEVFEKVMEQAETFKKFS